MYKIKTILPYNTHKLLESYLYDRKCVVRCNTAISDDFTVGARVPQGSVLGPTLYTRLKHLRLLMIQLFLAAQNPRCKPAIRLAN